MELRIVATDLPGRSCAPGPGFPGADEVHGGVQRRGRPGELLGLRPGDAPDATWSLECAAVRTPRGVDLRGPYLQGGPHARFVYLSWGSVDRAGGFAMFRRAKLMLDAVEPETVEAAVVSGVLVARLGLTDGRGNPLCAAVRPPAVTWSAG
ncbi:hypothetical protein GCM10010441_24700 [Kitasatospora paracochleata]|uniref:Monooxygenase n=1 Tax=Kitasatospora paracochleata TaxID=58354 RepID=A0ABT1J1I7_9ACTN|nr:DUF5990 family protein [Kitasatospora paracochleata]MCP2311024.1 hypothetical protein [Kitasatospora paracochleata]